MTDPGRSSGGTLWGRTALISGAGRGVGRACALALARAGADVALLARTREQLDETAAHARAVGRRTTVLAADVTDPAAVDDAVRRAAEALGPATIVVAAAGIGQSAPFLETTDALWERHLRTNAGGAFYIARAALPAMLAAGWGRVVFIGSVVSRTAAPYTAAYAASKHAVLGLARALAAEYGGRGITANAVCPGYLDTEMTAASIANIVARTGRTAEQARDALAAMSPQRRLFTPEEVALTVAFLCSEGAAGINGQAIVLDGGALLA